MVNVGDLTRFDAGTRGRPRRRSREAGLAKRKQLPVKLLGDGALDRAIVIRVHAASASARAKVEAAGGRVEILDPKVDRGAKECSKACSRFSRSRS